MAMGARNWVNLLKDADTGIETIHAHFEGHAYDPHWHDSYLVGFTEHGVQQFDCRGKRHVSTPGKVFLLEPGDIHDGEAPTETGFTYRTLYLDPHWLQRELRLLSEDAPNNARPGFAQTLTVDGALAQATAAAFDVLQQPEMRIVRQASLDRFLARLAPHLRWRLLWAQDPRLPRVANRARDYLHAHLADDIGLDTLAAITGTDRFRLSRAFKAAFGMAPHAYLIQLRLSRARHLLAQGNTPAQVAAALGFADQSHLGRWFMRGYRMTPALYRKRCSNLPD
jgi:AraC-like DNA-binding protein